MAGLENINDVVGQQAYDQLEKLLKGLDAATEKMLETSKVFKNNPLSIGGKGSTKEDIAYINKLIAAQKEYQKVTEQATKAENSATAAKRAKLAAQREVGDQLMREKLIITNETAAINENTAAAARNTSISAADAEAHAIANAATARQTPTLAANTVAQEANAIAITEATAAQVANNAAMSASTSGAGGIVGATAGLRKFWSVLRQAAYILPGIGIAGIVGGAIAVISNFFDANTSEATKASKANKEYQKTLEDVAKTARKSATEEISNITVLTTLAADNTQTTRTRIRAVKDLQETYPETFGALTQQAILEGNLGDAVNTTTQALLNRAAAQAAEKRFAAASERIYDVTQLLESANQKLKEVNAELNSTTSGRDAEERGLNQFEALRKRTQLTSDIADLSTQLSTAQADQAKFLSDAQQSAALAGDLFFKTQPKPKDTSAKELRDEIKDEDNARKARLAGEKGYQDALRDNRNASAEENIKVNEKIFEDDKQSLENRLEAYNEYVSGKHNQITSNAQYEISQLNAKVAEIELIEKEDISHRSAADEVLLAQKKGILERIKGLEEKQAAELADLAEESAQKYLKIQETYSKRQVELLESQLAEQEDVNDRERLSQMQGLLNQAKQGLITWQDYQQQKAKLTTNAQQKELQDENIALFNEIERTDLTQDTKEKLIKKYYD